MGHMAMVRPYTLYRPPEASYTVQVSLVSSHNSHADLSVRRLMGLRSAAVLMVWWNYRLCVTTSPGGVPDGYVSLTSSLRA